MKVSEPSGGPIRIASGQACGAISPRAATLLAAQGVLIMLRENMLLDSFETK